MKISHIIFVCFYTLSQIVYADRDADRVRTFHQVSLTRGWELGLWRIRNERQDNDSARYFKLSMTAQAFRYWLLSREGLIDRSLALEEQMRKSFSDGSLDVATLKNPLNRDENGEGGFGIGLLLTAEEYKNLSEKFEMDYLEK